VAPLMTASTATLTHIWTLIDHSREAAQATTRAKRVSRDERCPARYPLRLSVNLLEHGGHPFPASGPGTVRKVLGLAARSVSAPGLCAACTKERHSKWRDAREPVSLAFYEFI